MMLFTLTQKSHKYGEPQTPSIKTDTSLEDHDPDILRELNHNYDV